MAEATTRAPPRAPASPTRRRASRRVTASTLARPRRAVRRADGPGHRPRRLRAAGAGQAADDDGAPRGGDRASSATSSRGARVEYEGTELQLPWTGRWTLPVWVAGYGPMALAMTGRVADGVILQLADPDLIRWFVAPAARGRRPRPAAAGLGQGPGGRAGPRRRPRRRPGADPLVPGARQQPRRRPRQQVPARAAARGADRATSATARATTTSTTPRWARPTPGSSTTRWSTGSASSASADEHIAKLRELAEAGVDQFNIYLMNGDEEEQLEIYGPRHHPGAPRRGGRAAPDRGTVARSPGVRHVAACRSTRCTRAPRDRRPGSSGRRAS